MSLAPQLKGLLVCPLCKGKVDIREDDQEIWCRADGLAFPIRDDIPALHWTLPAVGSAQKTRGTLFHGSTVQSDLLYKLLLILVRRASH